MRKFFEPTNTDTGLSEILFTDEDNKDKFVIEIIGNNAEYIFSLKGDINGLKKIYGTDTAEKQSFDIHLDEKKKMIRLVGNVYNAFKILHENKLISENLHKEISSDQEIISFLEKSKSAIPYSKEMTKELNSSKSDTSISMRKFNVLKPVDNLIETEETFIQELLKSDPDRQKEILEKLALDINKLGVGIAFNNLDNLKLK
jgi:hypothetical protein